MPNPADALTDQFLGWIAEGGRGYGEVMDAWRSSCPRLTIWEDALIEGLVQVEHREGTSRREARVTLTALGRARLSWQAKPRPEAPGQAAPLEPLRARTHIR